MPTHIPKGTASAAPPESKRPSPDPEPGSSCTETLRALYGLIYHCSITHQHEGAEQEDEFSEFSDRASGARD